jgi:membrane-bound metal-dependent hydrolase YbcI (DUF457 family)
MDTFTHGIVGALIGKAFFADEPSRAASWREPPQTAGRVAILSATIGAMFPDVDVFAGPLANNSLALMTWHRNITHSVIMLPLWAVALAGLTFWAARRLRWPAPTFSDLVAIYAVAVGSHILLDVMTSFGTMVWSPLSYSRVAWDTVFIIDLSVTALALVPQLAAWAFRPLKGAWRRALPLWGLLSATAFGIGPLVRRMDVPFSTGVSLGATAVFGIFLILPLRRGGSRLGRVKWCRMGMAVVAAYFAFAAAMHHNALQQVTKFAEEAHLGAHDIAAIPLPPSPTSWAGLITTANGVYRVQFDQLGSEPFNLRFFAQAAPNRYVEAARELSDVQTFLWFARFPLFQYFERDGKPVVDITDLRFYGPRPRTVSKASSGDPPPNFTFEVVFAPDGRIVSHGRLRPD